MILHPAQHGSGHLGLDARHIGAYDHIILDFDRKSCAWRRYEHQHLTTCLKDISHSTPGTAVYR